MLRVKLRGWSPIVMLESDGTTKVVPFPMRLESKECPPTCNWNKSDGLNAPE